MPRQAGRAEEPVEAYALAFNCRTSQTSPRVEQRDETVDVGSFAGDVSIEADPAESVPGARRQPVTRPRPGHADLAGSLKYGHRDLRDVLERASARETAARVAAGAVARALLSRYGIQIASHVIEINGEAIADPVSVDPARIQALDADDDVRCVDEQVASRMRATIDRAREAGDTVGGSFEIVATGVPPGLGSYVSWDRKLDGRLAQALMSIHAIKAVGLGRATEVGRLPGSRVHDEIVPSEGKSTGTLPGLSRPTNNAGGLEGGVTNGEPIRVTAWMKPISTLMKPLRSVDLETMAPSAAAIERSDVCAVPAAAVVGEAMLALVLADAVLEKFGGDSVDEIDAAWQRYADELAARLSGPAQG